MRTLVDYAIAAWSHRFPELSRGDVLADLWHQGIKTNETFAAANQRRFDELNRQHNVVSHPDQFAGWHVGWVTPYKTGVLKFFATRRAFSHTEEMNGFVGYDVLRVAIETHVIEKPNGFTLPLR